MLFAATIPRSDTNGHKIPAALLLLTNSIVLGAGLRYAITRLFIKRTRQIETQQDDDTGIDIAPRAFTRRNDLVEPVKHKCSTEECVTSTPNQFIVSIRGLQNRGQTCYCNCVLQALASSKLFYNHLENIHKKNSNLSNRIVDALHRTIKYVNGHEATQEKERASTFGSIIPIQSPGDPKSVMDLVANHYSQFRSRNNLGIAGTTEQQDSHEFLSALMDVLSMEEESMKSAQDGLSLKYSQLVGIGTKETGNKSTFENKDNAEHEYNELREEKKHDDKPTIHHQATNISQINGRRDKTTLNPFDGWLGSTIKCASCLHVRPIRSSPFVCLSLPIAEVRSEFLEDFLASEYGGFATAERVSDVQCVACAVKGKLNELEDEEMLLAGAIDSMKRRNKGTKDKDGLETELVCKKQQIAILKGIDVDNDDEIQDHNQEVFSISVAGLVGLPKIVPMRGSALKATLIMRPPKVLCVHIQRRLFDMSRQQMVKISRRVRFPELLDLSKYSAYGENSFENERTTKSTGWSKLTYELISVVEHKGSAFGGHYQTYRRTGPELKEWVLVSDESVMSRSWEDVQNCEAYMLFYEERYQAAKSV